MINEKYKFFLITMLLSLAIIGCNYFGFGSHATAPTASIVFVTVTPIPEDIIESEIETVPHIEKVTEIEEDIVLVQGKLE